MRAVRPVASLRAPLAVAVLALALAGCAAEVPNLDSPGSTIVCLGDSITAGVGAPRGAGFPALLEAALGVAVIDHGVPGDTSADGRARLAAALAADPWLVVVELGGNDLLRRRPIEATEADLAAIVEAVLAAGAVPMLVEIRGPFGSRYGDLFERLGERYDVPVVDGVLADVLADRALKSDAIHPNADGYRVIAGALADAIEPLVAERRRRGLPLAPARPEAA
ncbi:MAG TPA: GDSL-type esterase/lipase family protein [Thermoanaerobaculia bacterium]